MKHWPTCRCAECLKIHFSLGEKASDFRARPILGELLYNLSQKSFTVSWLTTILSKVFQNSIVDGKKNVYFKTAQL